MWPDAPPEGSLPHSAILGDFAARSYFERVPSFEAKPGIKPETRPLGRAKAMVESLGLHNCKHFRLVYHKQENRLLHQKRQHGNGKNNGLLKDGICPAAKAEGHVVLINEISPELFVCGLTSSLGCHWEMLRVVGRKAIVFECIWCTWSKRRAAKHVTARVFKMCIQAFSTCKAIPRHRPPRVAKRV